MNKRQQLILGIDPGLVNTGWGIIAYDNNKLSFIASGTILTKANNEFANRLVQIHQQLNEVIIRHRPTAAAIEITYVNKNFASSLKLAQARAVAMLTAALQGIAPAEYQAKTIKQALTGSGSADKQQISAMLSLLIPGLNITDNNAADAIAIAICHANYGCKSAGKANVVAD